MATTDKKRPDGVKTNWTWVNAERIVALHHDVAGGEASDVQFQLRAGDLSQDIHIDKLIVSLENAPGTDKTVTVAVSDGVTTMTVEVTGTATSGTTTTNNFDLDVSGKDLTVALSATAGTAAGCCTIVLVYHDVTIAQEVRYG